MNTERLRVLQIIPTFCVSGAEQMAGHLMVGLSEWHDVTGVGLYPRADSPIERKLQEANIPLWHLGKRPGFDPKLFRALDQVLQEVRPHIVHTHMSVLRYALPALMRRRIPLVVHTLHNLAERETDRFGRMLQWFAFRKTVVPVAISREVAASVRRTYGLECTAMIPNCIPLGRYSGSSDERVRWRAKEGLDRDAIVLTCVGRLDPQKNPLLLLQAFAAVDDPRTHLVMVGEGTLREQVQAFVREHKLERVHLLGTRNDIPECLAASDVFVISSDWEGSPLAVMEAMAAGLPVVGTTVGGVPELVASGAQGILVAPGDCAALRNAIKTLLDHPDRRAVMAKAARARATAEFGVERMSKGYSNLYQEALAGVAPRVRTGPVTA